MKFNHPKYGTLINQDCLEFLSEIPSQSITLVLIDPPYNIDKERKWDKWKTVTEYVEWLGSVFKECERVLKPNGSFYFFHNDFMQIVELQNYINKNTSFVFNSMISWVKPNFRNIAWQNKTSDSNLRTWFNIQEYCLFYTFQDTRTGLSDIYSRKDCFRSIKDYMISQKKAIKKEKGINAAQFNEYINKVSETSSVVSRHYFHDSQWCFPTDKIYGKLQTTGHFQREYENLYIEYQSFRPIFNIENGSNVNNVWYSKETPNGKLHSCGKPLDILHRIIKTSSNAGDIVLDCFMGSASTAIACIQTERKFIGCERDEKYCEIGAIRIEKEIATLESQLL